MKKRINLYFIFYFLIIFCTVGIFFHQTLKPSKYIIKKIVKKNYKYFVLQKNNKRFLNLYLDFVVQNYFKNNFLKNKKDINLISKNVKFFLADQDESRFFKIDLSVPRGVSMGATLIYGFGACESVNGILGLRLSKYFKNIELFSLYDLKNKISPHTLLRIKKEKKYYYVDIWGLNRNIKYFLDDLISADEINLSKYDESTYPQKFSPKLFEDGFVIKKYSITSYVNALFVKMDKIFKSKKVNKQVKLDELDSSVTLLQKNEELNLELVNLFVDARFYHMEGRIKMANKIYDKIILSNCNYNFCKFAKLIRIKNTYN